MTDTTPLRQRHRETTVELIIGAFAELTATESQFTMQDIADRAGVSIRTLYRYYPNREALVEGLDQALAEEVGPLPTTRTELVQGGADSPIRRSFKVFDENDHLVRALVVSRVTGALVDTGHAARTEAIRESLSSSLADKPEALRRQVLGLVRLMSGSLAWMVLTDDEIGLTSDEAGAAVSWAMRQLFESGDLPDFLE